MQLNSAGSSKSRRFLSIYEILTASDSHKPFYVINH